MDGGERKQTGFEYTPNEKGAFLTSFKNTSRIKYCLRGQQRSQGMRLILCYNVMSKRKSHTKDESPAHVGCCLLTLGFDRFAGLGDLLKLAITLPRHFQLKANLKCRH